MHIGYWWESQKERDHLEDKDVEGWRIFVEFTYPKAVSSILTMITVITKDIFSCINLQVFREIAVYGKNSC
jgi:hypothetical protein